MSTATQSQRKFTEGRIQQEIVRVFRNKYCLAHHDPRYVIFSVPNDGHDIKEQQRKIATGLMSGVSDLVVLLPKTVIFVEVKIEGGGVQSDKQKEFQQMVEKLGYVYIIVRSTEEFFTIVTPYIT